MVIFSRLTLIPCPDQYDDTIKRCSDSYAQGFWPLVIFTVGPKAFIADTKTIAVWNKGGKSFIHKLNSNGVCLPHLRGKATVSL